MTIKTISGKNLPTKLLVTYTAIIYLLMEKFNAAGWVWGVAGTLLGILWFACFHRMVNSEPVDLFNEKK